MRLVVVLVDGFNRYRRALQPSARTSTIGPSRCVEGSPAGRRTTGGEGTDARPTGDRARPRSVGLPGDVGRRRPTGDGRTRGRRCRDRPIRRWRSTN